MSFNANYHGLGELLKSLEMQHAMHKKAEEIATAAVAIAPVGDPSTDPHSGEYKSSFRVESGVQRKTTERAYGRVTNDAGHAAEVEFGNRNHAGQHVLSRAVDASRR